MPPSKAKNTRGKKIVVEEETEKFLNEVQLRPYIYDKSTSLHANRHALGKAWEDIGSTCGLTPSEAKDKYNSLRDKYTRIKNGLKLPSGSGRSKKSKAKLDEDKKFLAALSFLDKFTQKRRTLGSLEDERENEDVYETSSSESDICVNSPEIGSQVDSPHSQAASSQAITRKQKKKTQTKSESFDRILKAMEVEEDENDFFGASITAQLKKLSPRKAAVSRVKIQQVLVEAMMVESASAFNQSDSINMEPPGGVREISFEEFEKATGSFVFNKSELNKRESLRFSRRTFRKAMPV